MLVRAEADVLPAKLNVDAAAVPSPAAKVVSFSSISSWTDLEAKARAAKEMTSAQTSR
jgi:hypothetical protein